ncbi:hypothetical protein [Frigoribacterium sp. CG_9.8]|uniref:thiolase family protein n=1 Tax=Frigoribacterium sp. CG_9.8 TaxID=2787733 RepID=UPI00351C0010
MQALKIAPLPIAPWSIAGRGGPTLISVDDGLRASTTVETLAALRPVFARSGTITAGTSSQIADGAAAIVLMSSTAADALGITTLPPWSRTLSLPAQTYRCTRNRRSRSPLFRRSGRPRPSHRSIRCSYRRAPRSSACCARL